jgi:hypothetical protein
MAIDRRRANRNWHCADERGNAYHEVSGGAVLATLMDIRDEMQKLNAVCACPNFQQMPHTLHWIERAANQVDRIVRTISKKIPPRRKRVAK